MLSTLEPRYQPSNRSRLSEVLIPALYENEKSKLYSELQSSGAVSLTCDGWTSRTTESFLKVTCHFIKKNPGNCVKNFYKLIILKGHILARKLDLNSKQWW